MASSKQHDDPDESSNNKENDNNKTTKQDPSVNNHKHKVKTPSPGKSDREMIKYPFYPDLLHNP